MQVLDSKEKNYQQLLERSLAASDMAGLLDYEMGEIIPRQVEVWVPTKMMKVSSAVDYG